MFLAETQRAFAAAVLDMDLPPPGSIEAGRDEAGRLLRFNIYRNNVFVALVSALEARFPVVSRIVGIDFFKAAARVYAGAEPSRSAYLDYGMSFPEFLAGFEPVADTPYLPDVARIEWARHEAYNAPDAVPLTATAFAALSPDLDTALALHPAARIMSSTYPIHAIWAANARDGASGPLELPDHGEAVLVTRPDEEVAVRAINLGAAAFASALVEGATLGEAYERTASAVPEFSLETALRDLLLAGALGGIAQKQSSIRNQEETQ